MSSNLAAADLGDVTDTFAELLEQLGDVPPSRILMRPAPGTATEADLMRLLDREPKRICELVDGTLVEKAMGFNESGLAAVLIELLSPFVRSRNLGLVNAPDGAVRLWAGRVRSPDVSFISWDRLPGRCRPVRPLPDVIPDLAVEVLSVSNTRTEMERKRREYFSAGVRLVWEIDPLARTVSVYTTPDDPTVLTPDDTLTGGDVLPDFVLPLADFFAELDRHG